MYQILILGLLTQALAKDCSLLPKDYTKIVAKNSEILVKPVSSFFNQVKYNENVKLEDQGGNIILIPPIQLTSSIDQPLQPPLTSFISFSVLMNDHQDWLNKFQLLGQRAGNEQILMSTKNYKPGTQTRSPVFDTFHILEPSTKTTYYSSAILDNNHLIIDCYSDDEGVQQNFFYLIDETTIEKTKIPNNYPFLNQERLQIQSTDKYIYRGTQKGRDSIIEIFAYDFTAKTVTLNKTIDADYLQKLFKTAQYQFDLIDFKAGKDDSLAILDRQGNILILYYRADQDDYSYEWFDELLGEPISFDFDFSQHHYAVILKNAMKSYFNFHLKTYTTTDDLSLAKAQLTKDFLLLTSSTQIIQFKDTLEIVSILEGDFSYTLHDYQQNDFLTFGFDKIKHYRLHDQFQIIVQNPTQTSGSATLTLNGCTVTIDYQNIEKDSVELIQVSKGQLIDTPLYSGSYNKEVKPTHLVDGPKQKIKFQDENGQNIDSLIYKSDLTLMDETFKLSDIVYVQTVSYLRIKDSPYQIVTQNKNLLITAYDCIQQTKCTKKIAIQTNVQLNTTNSIVSKSFDVLKVAVLVSPILFIVHEIHPDGTYHERKYDIEAELQIDSFYLCNFNVVLFSSSKKTMSVRYLEAMYEIHKITPEVMAKQGVTNWNPKKLYGNDLDEFFFVMNGDSEAILFKFDSYYYSIAYIMTDLKNSKDNLFLNFQNRFALVQQFDNGQIEFNIYNKQDQANIYLEKQLSIYSYKISDLENFFIDSYNGFVNVKAQTDQQVVVLTYQIDETSHNALHYVTIVNSTNKYLTCTQNNIFFFDQNALYIHQIQTDPTLVYRVPEGNTTFVFDAKYKIVYSNEMILLIDQTFRLINTDLDVKIDQKKINLTYNLTSNQQDHHVYDLGTEWFQGSVSQFELSIPQNQDSVTIISPIELVQSNYISYTKSVVDLNADYIFILKNDTYVIMSKQLNTEETSVQFEDFTCEDILGNFAGQLLLKCMQSSKSVIVGIKCEGKQCTIGSAWIKQTDLIIKTYFDGEILFLISSKKVEVYKANILELSAASLLGVEDFSDLERYFYAITVQKIYSTHYQIYCIDWFGKFNILDYKLANNQFIRNNKESFDLVSFVNYEFYSMENAYYTHMLLMNIQLDDKIFKADYLVSPTIGPHYGINMEFTCADDVCKLKSKKIVFALQGYGSYELLGHYFPTILMKDSYVIIPYIDSKRKQLIFTVYNLPQTQTTQSAVLFFGAVELKYLFFEQEIQFACYLYDQQPYLLVNAEAQMMLSRYKLNASPKLMLNGQIKNSFGILKIKNDYSNDQVVIMINAPDDPVDDGSNHTVIWVIFGIIGGGLVIGAGIYCYKKKQTKVDTLI